MEELGHIELLQAAQDRVAAQREAAAIRLAALTPAQVYLQKLRAQFHPELSTTQD